VSDGNVIVNWLVVALEEKEICKRRYTELYEIKDPSLCCDVRQTSTDKDQL